MWKRLTGIFFGMAAGRASAGNVSINGVHVSGDLSGRTYGMHRGSAPHYDGPVKAVTRDCAAFQEIVCGGPIQVVWAPAALPTLVIEAAAGLAPLISTTRRGGALHIECTGPFSSSQPIVVRLGSPHLSRVVVEGSGDVLAQDIKGDSLSILVKGSGSVKLSGQARLLSATVSGSGSLKARQLRCETVEVSLTGSGSASVHAAQQIKGSVLGSGSLSVSGNPAGRQVSVKGSGDVDFD